MICAFIKRSYGKEVVVVLVGVEIDVASISSNTGSRQPTATRFWLLILSALIRQKQDEIDQRLCKEIPYKVARGVVFEVFFFSNADNLICPNFPKNFRYRSEEQVLVDRQLYLFVFTVYRYASIQCSTGGGAMKSRRMANRIINSTLFLLLWGAL